MPRGTQFTYYYSMFIGFLEDVLMKLHKTGVVYESFRNIINYLQSNNLVTHVLLSDSEQVTDETSIKKSDLTEEGFELVKKVHDKWLDKVVDKKIQANNFRLLDKELLRIRGSKV